MNTQPDQKIKLLTTRPFTNLPLDTQLFIERKNREYALSYQSLRNLIEFAVDLHQWDESPVDTYWDDSLTENLKGTARGKKILQHIRYEIEVLRNEPIIYDGTEILQHKKPNFSFNYLGHGDTDGTLLGTCPVAGERTRCCNLLTLDAVEQCGFSCSYCSIQSFYDTQNIYFHDNLKDRLKEIELNPDTLYHIGTGQSSDSLMWGNRNDLLKDLFTFAAENPNVILELKSKSSRTDWVDELQIPDNVISTWSLNAPSIIINEEHRTASLDERLQAARKVADKKGLVGFHIHPIVHFEGWEEEYRLVAEKIQELFNPEEVVMISLGTLTYIKPVLRMLRESGIRSKMLKIPMADASGKLSYPVETKEMLFKQVYSFFSGTWKEQVFFYLCMEPHKLWDTVFGKEYESNDEFENSMKISYMEKINLACKNK